MLLIGPQGTASPDLEGGAERDAFGQAQADPDRHEHGRVDGEGFHDGGTAESERGAVEVVDHAIVPARR